MRSQWCREHIDETAKECGLDQNTVSEVKQAAKFCSTLPDFSDCSTKAIIALIRIKDEPVKNRAISLAKNALIEETPTGGKKRDKLTEREIKKLIQKAEIEIRGELTKQYEKERKKSSTYNGTPQPGDFQGADPVEHKSLADRTRAQEMAQATANQPPTPGTDTPPCKAGNPCPEGRNYLIKQPILGNKCEQTGSLIANLSYCPVQQRQKAALINGAIFTTGGQVKAVDERVSSVIPRVAQNQPMALTIKFTAKRWGVLKQIVREGQAETLEEAVLFLVDEAGDRMEAL